MADIFISYRRTDAAGHARALHRDLCQRFPADRIFFDRESIESGEKFHERIRVAVTKCQVLLALIGPGWRDARDSSGNRRLDNPQDVVRGEIALALRLGKTVIPVLFDDTPVPQLDELPDLKPLSGHDALTLRGKTYEYDVQLNELVRLLAQVPGMPAPVDIAAAARHYYEGASAKSEAEAEKVRASELLSAMPLDRIPDCAPLPAGSRSPFPFSANPHFVGRIEDLKWLAQTLKQGTTAAIGQIAVATGLGGIGKTQLAVEFAHRYGQYFAGGVHWVGFADPETIPTEIAACWGEPRETDLELRVRSVLSAWQSEVPRLLIFDYCEDEALLEAWRPRTGGCRVLVTSRKGRWESLPAEAARPLGVLDREESIALLRKSVPGIPHAPADAIAQELGDLPLALHLSGSFMKRYQVGPGAYLEQLRDPALLDHPALTGRGQQISPTRHDFHVARTFALSVERLNPEDPVDQTAIDLLSRAVCFAHGVPMPRELLKKTLELPDYDLEAGLQAQDGLLRLVELGLLEATGHEALMLHRLLARYVGKLWGNDGARDAVERVFAGEAGRINASGFPMPLLEWQIHLRAVTDKAMEREDEEAALLGNQLGYHLDSIGDYAGARPYYERALTTREKVLGPEHPDTAGSLNNLGLLLHAMGDFKAARPCYERALAIREKVLGPEHPDTARSLNNLGALLQAMGDFEAARPYYERALAIREKVLGPEHPDTAGSLNNLGALLDDMGDFKAARPYLERGLAIFEKVLGSEHPDTAKSLNNLGGLLQEMGDFKAARPYFERALAISEKGLGPEHPVTATSLNNLGGLLQEMGDFKAARPYYERALAIFEKVLGPEHPDTAGGLNNLGLLLKATGDFEAARPYYDRALAIYEKVLGPEHPYTATSVNNLGFLLQAMGDFKAARPYYERAVAIYEKVLGPEHPDTAKSLNNLGGLLDEMGDLEAARPYYERALAIRQKVLGPEHPKTKVTRENLALLTDQFLPMGKGGYISAWLRSLKFR